MAHGLRRLVNVSLVSPLSQRLGLSMHARRCFSTESTTTTSTITNANPTAAATTTATTTATTVKVVFKDSEGGSQICFAAVGKNILDVAIDNNIDIEGACGGTLACSTCHVIVDKKYYDMLPEPQDEELDMLDLAFGLTSTSRLGCQILLTPAVDGIEVTLPDEVSDARRP